MRIAIVHSYYRPSVPSGENALVGRQVAALEQAGHEVLLIHSRSKDTSLPMETVRSALRVGTGLGRDPLDRLRMFRPELVHVHNLFPNFGDGWLAHWPGPMVASLHNFRPICANAILFRDNRHCTDCIDGSALAGLRHGCYRSSRVATLPLTISQVRTPPGGAVVRDVDLVTVPSERTRAQYERAGLDSGKLRVVPAGVEPVVDEATAPPGSPRFLTAGRLAEEKGFLQLLQEWPDDVLLDLRGDGPLRDELLRVARPGIRVLPPLSQQEYVASLPEYTGFVFPSVWQETQGMAAVEALAAGLPVVAREQTATADFVAQLEPRWVYRDGASLAEAVGIVQAAGRRGRDRALSHYQNNFTMDRWIDGLLNVYEEALEGSATA